VDGLVDQRPAAFGLPASLDGAGVILGRSVPLHIGVSLHDAAQTPLGDGAGEEQARVVKTMLAHHAEPDAALARGLNHPAGRLKGGCHGLLHLYVLARPGASFDRRQPEVRERADVHEIDRAVMAHVKVGWHELSAPESRELPPDRFMDVRADGDLITDVAVDLCVLVRNRTGADDPNAQ